MKKIYFCRKNDAGTKHLYKFLRSHYKGIKIKQKDCLGACKACKNRPFTLIDGEVVQCKNVDELFLDIQKRMAKEWKKSAKK